MKTSLLTIYPQNPQELRLNPGKIPKTEKLEMVDPLKISKLDFNSTSNPEIIVTQVHLEAIESEIEIACALYHQLCCELDSITFQNHQGFSSYLQPEQEKTCQEILTLIQEICQLELKKKYVCSKLESLFSEV